MSPRVAIVIPYFGKWPEWMDLYLYTCSNQKMVDFLFFTDCGIPEKSYENTKFFVTDFEQYCERISKTLDIYLNPAYGAYQLCGCRPFYGIIHEKELEGYEYWGFGDIDLIYGDLSLMINDEILDRYDFISSHSYRVAGHLTIMKNIKLYNDIAYSIPDWKTKLESEVFHGLDEEPEYGYLVNPCLHLIGRLYYYCFRFFYKKNKYRFFDLAQKILQPFHKRSLFKEMYTTPVPKLGDRWYYDMRTKSLVSPNDSWYKMSETGGKAYLHFLFFKKNCYRETGYSWGGDAYRIPAGFDFENAHGRIVISTDGIEYEP